MIKETGEDCCDTTILIVINNVKLTKECVRLMLVLRVQCVTLKELIGRWFAL